MDFSAGGRADGLMFGADCMEVSSGQQMMFSVPTPEQLAASLTPTARRAAAGDWLFDQIAAQGYTDELAQLAEKLYQASEAPVSPDDRDTFDTFAEHTEQLVTSAEALVDQFEREGESPGLVTAIDRLVRNNDRWDD
jgi:hypothetical protein